ncbi:MAG: DNA alkylation repair protein [Candidatus Korobacteraceae bacterium]|jgi:3-methyladenine DNA glycosylase AlkD
MKKTPAYIAKHIRTVIKNGGSAPHTEEVQRFFKHEVQSRGWYTGELRKVAVRFRRTIIAENGVPFLLQVAEQLFRGEILEEKILAVVMLQGIVADFGKAEFKLFESWLDRISTWADHDALVHYLIGPMIAANAAYLSRPPRWARKKSRNPWHQRAAAVGLIHSTRQHKNFGDIQRITEVLLTSDDDMVQKGLGWLLREAAKANPKQTVAYLMTIRDRTPRLVLRTACETLPAATRARVLAKAPAKSSTVGRI